MAIVDYRFDPFLNVLNTKAISREMHQVPNNSPYMIRLNEVPQKTDPTTLQVVFANGVVLTEVAAQPAQGQYWPDYNTTAHGIKDWNTGQLLFNAADAGKYVYVTYAGLGTLTDERLQDMLELPFTTSTQPERDVSLDGTASSYDGTEETGYTGWGKLGHDYVRIKQHKGLPAGTYTLRQVIQHLVNRSQTFEFIKGIRYSECNCDCSDDT